MTAVAAPDRIAGRLERLAYERAERMHALADQPGGHPKGYWFDEDEADWAVEFIETRCRHHIGEWAGQPLVLEEWQRFTVREVFGWKQASGVRLFTVAWEEIPRKNGKSEKAGAVAVKLLVADDEPGAQVFTFATKEEQAKIVWEVAKEMVKRDPVLRDEVVVRQKTLSCAELGSSLKPLGSDSETQDGLNPHGLVGDEIHAHKTRALWDVLDTARGSRRQPLTWAITTAGIYNPESIGWQLHDHAVKVLEGAVDDDQFFAFIACADPDDDPFAVETQAKANPNYGVSVKPDYLAAQAKKAKDQPSFYNTYCRLHLNWWTEQEKRWLSMEKWNACQGAIDLAALRGRLCYGALDLGQTIDLCALALAFPMDGVLTLLFRFWCPNVTIMRRSREDRVPYDAWKRDGFLTATDGDITDYDVIEADVLALRDQFDIRELAYDPWNANQVTTHLQSRGMTLVEMRQGFASLSGPSKEFERRIVGGRLRHDGNPVMRWMVSNVTVREDPAGNIKPDKSTPTGRIDGVVAGVMAVGRAVLQPPPFTGSLIAGFIPHRRG